MTHDTKHATEVARLLQRGGSDNAEKKRAPQRAGPGGPASGERARASQGVLSPLYAPRGGERVPFGGADSGGDAVQMKGGGRVGQLIGFWENVSGGKQKAKSDGFRDHDREAPSGSESQPTSDVESADATGYTTELESAEGSAYTTEGAYQTEHTSAYVVRDDGPQLSSSSLVYDSSSTTQGSTTRLEASLEMALGDPLMRMRAREKVGERLKEEWAERKAKARAKEAVPVEEQPTPATPPQSADSPVPGQNAYSPVPGQNAYTQSAYTQSGYTQSAYTQSGYTPSIYDAEDDLDTISSSTSSDSDDALEIPASEFEAMMAEWIREAVYARHGRPTEVQEVFKGGEVSEGLSLLRETLRDNAGGLVDVPEQLVARDGSISENAIGRARLSRNEQGSEGWALVAMRDDHLALDQDKSGSHYGRGTTGVTYFYDTEEQTKSRRGGHQELGREDLAIKLVDGKLLRADDSMLDTSDAGVVSQALCEKKLLIKQELDELRDRIAQATEQGDDGAVKEMQAQVDSLSTELANIGQDADLAGRYIFVMNAAGAIYAGKSVVGAMHHSSFLAGGAVAAAGEIVVEAGELKMVSNVSGHYRPGPIFLWQAVRQIVENGVDPSAFRVQCMGVREVFGDATTFLAALDPSDPQVFDTKYAVAKLKGGSKT